MEKTSDTAYRCSDDALTPPPSRYKTAEFRRPVKLTDGFWPFLSSLTLHALLFGILSIPAFQIRTSTASQTPTVLWFSSFMLPDDNGEIAGMTKAEAEFTGEPETGEPPEPPQANAATGDPSPFAAPEPESDPTNASAPHNSEVIIAENKPPEPAEADNEMVLPKSVAQPAPLPSPVQKKVTQPPLPLKAEPAAGRIPVSPIVAPATSPGLDETDQLSRRIAEEKRVAAEKFYQEQILREQEQLAENERLKQLQAAAAEKARQDEARREKLRQEQAVQKEALLKQEAARLAMIREQEQRAENERLKQQQAAATEQARQDEARREKLRQEQAAQKEALLKQEAARLTMVREQEQRAADERSKQEQKKREIERKEQRPTQKPDKAQGITIPLLTGDLKLLIKGAVMPETAITFREFALSRRKRPFSRNEARSQTRIIPQTATLAKDSRAIVIEKIIPGVYTVTVSPEGTKNDVNFSLLLYEGTSRSITRDLGSHTLTAKKELFKILMPEGILWQDDKAFTGSMEDSSGVTKFNAQTGLMWKEYAE